MIDSQLITFIGITLLFAISPGADSMLVLKNSISGKRTAGIVTTFGVCCGLLIHALLASLGISIILLRFSEWYEVIKLVGAGYLFFLGIQSIVQAYRNSRSDQKTMDLKKNNSINSSSGKLRFFLNGFITNLFNPKVVLFYLAFLPQFINETDTVILKSILLGGIHLFFSFTWLIFISYLVSKLKKVFQNRKLKILIESLSGLILIGLALKIALEKK